MFGNFGNTSTFGGGAFSAPTSNASVFGQPQQQPGPSTSLFGGGFNQPKQTFGSTFGAPQAQNSMFGQQNRLPVPPTGSLFSGPTATVSPFSSTGQTQVAGTSIPFNAITGSDTMMKNGVASPISTRHQCITCMKEYENKSLEELRLEDYQLNRKGPSQNSLFGGTQPQQQQSTGLFSTIGTTATPTAFGQTNAFGGTNTGTGGLFNTLNQPKPANSFFSSPATSTSAFGATTSGFAFNSTPSQQPSVFGSNNNPISSTPSAFSFGQPQAQPQQTGSLFGAKPLTTTSSSFGGFGAPTLTNSTTANKPVVGFGFGSTPSAFGSTATPGFGTGTGSLFGSQPQQQQAKPFSFSTPFSTQTAPTQSTFGSTGSAFSFAPSTSAPTLNFGSGSNTTFGGLGSTVGNFGATPTFSAGGAQTSTGFGSSLGFNSGSTMGFGNFNSSTNFGQSALQQPAIANSIGAAFATTPYKDSPLFYNLVANRKLEDMIKPTSPAAQRAIKEASRRRTSASVSLMSNTSKSSSLHITRNRSFNKQSIFDGFDDDEKGITLDILSPKTSVKKLTLKNFRNTSLPSHRHSISFSPAARRITDNGLNDSDNSILDNTHANDVCGANPENQVAPNYPAGVRNKSSEDLSVPNIELDTTGINSQKRMSNPNERSILNGEKDKRGCGVINTRGGYYIHPSVEELDTMVDEAGNCFVRGLVIGRLNFGEIRFLEDVNVAGLNLDELVYFRHKEVVVYPDDSLKPPLGEGLNCRAEIRMERIWPIDKATMDPIKSPAKLKAMGYTETLQRSCNRLDAEFISYNAETGVWTFVVRHFSRYSCGPEESEEEAKHTPPTTVAPRGLGGISMQQMKSNLSSKPRQEENEPEDGENMNPDAPKRWESPMLEMDGAESVFGQRLTAQEHSTPLVHVSSDDGNGYGDVEHNPLTPSESNDSDLEWQLASGRSYSTDYEGISRRKQADSIFTETMKALMLSGEHGDIGDFEPPIKRSRPPLLKKRVSSGDPSLSGMLRKSKSSKILKSRATGPSLAAVMEAEEEQANVVKPGYLISINKKSEIKYFPAREDLFERLTSFESNGCKIKTVPRVCFGPGGIVVRTLNSGTIKFRKIQAYRDMTIPSEFSTLYWNTIDEQMKLELSDEKGHVGKHIEVLLDVDMPMTKVMEDRQTQEEALSEARRKKKTHKGDFGQEIMMWELCEILWPLKETREAFLRDKAFPFRQRDELGNWFTKHGLVLFGHQPYNFPFKTQDPTDNSDHRQILELLKLGKKYKASELALKTGNDHLAMCIVAHPDCLNVLEYTTSHLIDAMGVCKRHGASPFLTAEMRDIYHLICADPIFTGDTKKICPYEWLQNFAIDIWYINPHEDSVPTLVNSYLSEVEQSVPRNESFGDYSIPNLCIQLLKLYCIPGYPLKKVLDPLIYGSEPLDYKLSWQLMVTLGRFGYVCGPELRESITTSYAGQLEQIGLWEWAIFVLNKLPDTFARNCMAQRILERNIGTGKRPGYCETFLLETHLFPYTTIYAAKLFQASHQHRESLKRMNYAEYLKLCKVQEMLKKPRTIRAINRIR